ncbi:33775_t:CDS:2, partial [Racocetra persica]
ESNKDSFLASLDHESVASSDYQSANVIKRGGSQSTSKVWKYFDKDDTSGYGICCVKVVGKDSTQPCSKKIRYSGSTGNYWYHLRTAHGIFNTDGDDLTILTDEGFTELIAEAFPFYKLPSEKMVKSILLESYNYVKQTINLNISKNLAKTGLMATLLDPRSKSLSFISPYDAQKAFDNLHILYNNSSTNTSAMQFQENSNDSLLAR